MGDLNAGSEKLSDEPTTISLDDENELSSSKRAQLPAGGRTCASARLRCINFMLMHFGFMRGSSEAADQAKPAMPRHASKASDKGGKKFYFMMARSAQVMCDEKFVIKILLRRARERRCTKL